MTSGIRVFVAGASGAIGRRLCALLVADGHHVTGTTRSSHKLACLQGLGVSSVAVDVFDADALHEAVVRARPDVVVHQLTDLPPALDPTRMAQARERNARLRDVGTRHLVAAAAAAGVRRLVAQSIAFAYAPGPQPFDETAPLNAKAADPGMARTVQGVMSLERQVLAGPFEGVVLRYGKLYGPGTGIERPPSGGPVHVDAAADAARRALALGDAGVYNIAEDDGSVSSDKARAMLHWRSDFRMNPA